MELNKQGFKEKSAWEEKGYQLFSFDREAAAKKTKESPFWIHFGAGNLFRAFPAHVVQKLLNEGILDKGLIVAEGYDYEIIEKINRPHDDYSLLVTLKADGSIEKTVIGSIVESLTLDSENEKDFSRLQEIFACDSLQMASFTITEKGYSLVDGNKELLPSVSEDMKNGPGHPLSYAGKIAGLLYTRYLSGKKPVSMVSLDNCSHNGTKLYEAISAFAKEWNLNGLADKGFVSYISNPDFVAFPWTMIDKITPRPDPSVEDILAKDGLTGIEPLITSKKSYAAPFVNAEECEYLVVEDAFPNGRPKLEAGGILFTSRDIVEKAEKMKVSTCLNPLHTALAIFGCLLGYEKISDEMDNPLLRKLVEGLGYEEGLPVAANPGILDPKEFLDQVVKVRIPNPFMPDTPQRIATDTSQKLAIRFGETIKSYAVTESYAPRKLTRIPLIFAGWLRYLLGIDDEGESFPLSPDPLLDTICPMLSNIRLGEKNDVRRILAPLLKDRKIWGVDLYETGLAQKVCAFFSEMTAGPGAVQKTLETYL